jgi:hypothetical protein
LLLFFIEGKRCSRNLPFSCLVHVEALGLAPATTRSWWLSRRALGSCTKPAIVDWQQLLKA